MTTPPETNQAPAETPAPEGPVSQIEDDGRFGENRTEDPYEPGRRASNAFRIAVGTLILAIFLGAWWLGRDNRAEHKRAQSGGNVSTRFDVPKRIYFPAAHTAAMGALIDPQAAAANALMAGWWSTHSTKSDDKAFISWLAAALPGPTGDRTAELSQVQEAVKGQQHGNSEYLPAARYLSKQGLGLAPAKSNGPEPIWGIETAGQAALYDANTTADLGKWAGYANDLASQISAKANHRFQLSSPYVADPSLTPGVKVTKKGTCPCSYPAPHAAVAAAMRTLLGTLQPASDSEYAWLQSQIAYSSLFLGHAYPSDLVAGTLLGDAVGDYILVTRAGQKPATAP